MMADKTVRKVPHAIININTPFYTGKVNAVCLPDALYDLLIGNIEGAREPNNPDKSWKLKRPTKKVEEPLTTETEKEIKLEEPQRKQKRDLKTKEHEVLNLCNIGKEIIINMQQKDKTVSSPSGRIKLITESNIIYI